MASIPLLNKGNIQINVIVWIEDTFQSREIVENKVAYSNHT